jgi:hypothetical protein
MPDPVAPSDFAVFAMGLKVRKESTRTHPLFNIFIGRMCDGRQSHPGYLSKMRDKDQQHRQLV